LAALKLAQVTLAVVVAEGAGAAAVVVAEGAGAAAVVVAVDGKVHRARSGTAETKENEIWNRPFNALASPVS
jgi:hypothetical protein